MDLAITMLIIALLAVVQLWQRRKLVVKAKVTVVEKVAFGISLLIIVVVTLLGARHWAHYGIAAAVALLVLTALMKAGLTEKGINSMGRLLLPQSLSALKSATVILNSNGEEFELQTMSKGRSIMLTYDMAHLQKVMAIIKRELPGDKIRILSEEEYYRKGEKH